MKHYIHCHQAYNMNKGGTVGYVSSLIKSMQNNQNFISRNGVEHCFMIPNIAETERLPNYVYDKFENIEFHDIYEYEKDNISKDIVNRKEWFHSILPLQELMKIHLKQVKSIQIHGAYNFLPVYNGLKLLGLEGKVLKILMTHNPTPPALEDLEYFYKHCPPDSPRAKHFEFFAKKRQEYAYRMADAIVFPAKESMEAYYTLWPEFEEIIKNKPVYFCLTGTEKKSVQVPRKYLRKKYKINENDIVFLYLGRFMKIKGYDLFIEAAQQILAEFNNVHFITVGEEGKKPAIDHPHWHEMGFTTSPGDFINMADACVIANRESYFDLSMIEYLSLGAPLIASYVGGNKWLKDKTDGVLFFEKDNAEDLVLKFKTFLNMPAEEKNKMSRSNTELFDSTLDIKYFGKYYHDTVDQIYKDFNISASDNTNYTPLKLKFSDNARVVTPEKYTIELDTTNERV